MVPFLLLGRIEQARAPPAGQLPASLVSAGERRCSSLSALCYSEEPGCWRSLKEVVARRAWASCPLREKMAGAALTVASATAAAEQALVGSALAVEVPVGEALQRPRQLQLLQPLLLLLPQRR